ncbi:MAG: ABC transporter ATP-binding protein [Rhizobiales bacterium]|nr:ABC transporter ATP-binding protein [Hyphomicrobiales bacterium]
MTYLSLDRVTKKFRRETVLDGVSLDVERGEMVAIFGSSGGGKTVLLRLIAGVLDPDGGDIRIDGRSIVHQPPEARGLGMAFQNFALYPHMSAFDNIASPLRALGQSDADVRQGVERVADLLQIGHVLTHLPKALSNGQKQRTSLARALVRGPKLLLLDDPLRNVDAKLRYEMRVELPRLLRRTGATVLYVTQDYKEAMALGDRIAVLDGQRFAQIDTPARIYRDPVSTKVARLLGDPTINLQPTRLRVDGNSVSVELFGRTYPLQAKAVDAADCVIGIRPEHIKVSMTPTAGSQPAELDAVTPLNVRSVLLLKTQDGGELLASCTEAEAARLPRGRGEVWLTVASDHLLAFDAETGRRLSGGAPS